VTDYAKLIASLENIWTSGYRSDAAEAIRELIARAEKAEAECDALAAKLDKVREYARKTIDYPRDFPAKTEAARAVDAGAYIVAKNMLNIFDDDPSSVLAEVKAQVAAEVIDEFESLYFGHGTQSRAWVASTMRKRHGLSERTEDRRSHGSEAGR